MPQLTISNYFFLSMLMLCLTSCREEQPLSAEEVSLLQVQQGDPQQFGMRILRAQMTARGEKKNMQAACLAYQILRDRVTHGEPLVGNEQALAAAKQRAEQATNRYEASQQTVNKLLTVLGMESPI